MSASGAVLPTITILACAGPICRTPSARPPSDPTDEPMYPCPNDPAVYCYCYPDGTYSTTPYDFSEPE